MTGPYSLLTACPPAGAPPRLARGLRGWLHEGARGLVLLRPDWRGLHATPMLVASLLLAQFALGVPLERLYIAGEAQFYWRTFFFGWFGIAAVAWLCWLLVPRPSAEAGAGPQTNAPDAGSLLALLSMQGLLALPILAAVFVPIVRWGPSQGSLPAWVVALEGGVPTAWVFAIQATQLWRGATVARTGVRVFGAAAMAALFAVQAWVVPLRFWYAVPPSTHEDAAAEPLVVTQELMELQGRLLASQLDALAPQRRGAVDLYAITFAPYASEDVFRRESAMVAGVMAQRFDAAGRVVQLVNSNATATQLPWATPLNLQRTIAATASRMDRDEDVLFIHLTSHGGAAGRLAVDLDPLTIAPVTPQLLKKWLDDAGVRWRVISVSACYSGSWIAPLAGDGTLVMTAADAEHTSYGCGGLSPLTFLGQAMYDEELRKTWSFEAAHAAARKLIEERERTAGKKGGYSNPQISVGTAIRGRLLRLQAERASAR